jgi:hypothetical protein
MQIAGTFIGFGILIPMRRYLRKLSRCTKAGIEPDTFSEIGPITFLEPAN